MSSIHNISYKKGRNIANTFEISVYQYERIARDPTYWNKGVEILQDLVKYMVNGNTGNYEMLKLVFQKMWFKWWMAVIHQDDVQDIRFDGMDVPDEAFFEKHAEPRKPPKVKVEL